MGQKRYLEEDIFDFDIYRDYILKEPVMDWHEFHDLFHELEETYGWEKFDKLSSTSAYFDRMDDATIPTVLLNLILDRKLYYDPKDKNRLKITGGVETFLEYEKKSSLDFPITASRVDITYSTYIRKEKLVP